MTARLVDLAQEAVIQVLRPGDPAIDATLGNGHDCLFLARRVGPAGQVYAFDVQPQALERAAGRLRAAGVEQRVRLLLRGHQEMAAALPPSLSGRVRTVMFNLGYLPGSDRSIVTRADTTLHALRAACRLLAPGGGLSVLAYTGHPGGRVETEAVKDWAEHLDPDRWHFRLHRNAEHSERAPEWIWLQRLEPIAN